MPLFAARHKGQMCSLTQEFLSLRVRCSHFSSPFKEIKIPMYSPATRPPGRWIDRCHGSTVMNRPIWHSIKLQVSHVSNTSYVWEQAWLLSRQYSRYFASNGHPWQVADDRVTMQKFLRRWLSASSPWITKGTTWLRFKPLVHNGPNSISVKGTGWLRIGWLWNHSVSRCASQKEAIALVRWANWLQNQAAPGGPMKCFSNRSSS